MDPAGGRAAAAFTFNAWGNKYQPHDKDAALGERIAGLAGLPVYRSKLVVEGGGFLSDGEGTLITAETCVLNPNRNPGWTQSRSRGRASRHARRHGKSSGCPATSRTPKRTGTSMAMLPIVRPAAVLCEVVADPADPRYPIMAENRKVLRNGNRRPRAPIRAAPDCRSAALRACRAAQEGYCRSYVNFYIANGAVIAPAYGIAEDAGGHRNARTCLPDSNGCTRLRCSDLFRGGGGIHCITQQEPAASGKVYVKI